jgi:hypothetical protein
VDRDDLRDLPRSAILGTVELRGVHLGRALLAAKVDPTTTNWIEDALENAVRDPFSGQLRPGPAASRTLPEVIPPDRYVFGFARALAVEPITDVEGQQHLWALPTGLAAELSAREGRARSGAWTRPEPSAEAIRLARDVWRERFESEEVRYAVRLVLEAADEYASKRLPLEDEDAERMVREEMRKLTGERGARSPDGRVWVRVPKTLRSLFAGEERVLATRFETDLRLLIHRVRRKEKYDAIYAKLFDDAITRVREGLARDEQGPSSRSDLEAEVKRTFLLDWRQAEARMAEGDPSIDVPEY